MAKQLTKEQYEKLKAELRRLEIEERAKVAERIKKAKEFGDLSENAEYVEALKAREELERRIFEIRKLLEEAEVIKETSSSKNNKVSVGCKVKVKDLETNKTIVYEIVGFGESDPLSVKISSDSPVGKALLDKSVGETVEINLPKKTLRYKILEISK